MGYILHMSDFHFGRNWAKEEERLSKLGKWINNEGLVGAKFTDKLRSNVKLANMAKSSDPQIFAESIFPKAFSDAAQDSYMESQETYSSLFEDQSKYNAIMHTLADLIYHEMRRPGRE